MPDAARRGGLLTKKNSHRTTQRGEAGAAEAGSLLLEDLRDAALLDIDASDDDADAGAEMLSDEEAMEEEAEAHAASAAEEAQTPAAGSAASPAPAPEPIGLDGLYSTVLAEEEEALSALAAAATDDASSADASAVSDALRQLHARYERALCDRMLDEARPSRLRNAPFALFARA